jgi:hypothetical protein
VDGWASVLVLDKLKIRLTQFNFQIEAETELGNNLNINKICCRWVKPEKVPKDIFG